MVQIDPSDTADLDGDGLCDGLDADDDGDGYPDGLESYAGSDARLAIVTPSGVSPADPYPGMPGDVAPLGAPDGEITGADAVVLLNILSEKAPLDTLAVEIRRATRQAADLTGDHAVDQRDGLQILEQVRSATPVPEPDRWLLLIAGALGLGSLAWRRARRRARRAGAIAALLLCTAAEARAEAAWRVDAVRVYDAADRVVEVRDALGHATRFEYDALGRPVRTRSALGSESHMGYDAAGSVVLTRDGAGASTHVEYDAENRPVRTRDALGRVSRVEVDREGRVLRRYAPGASGPRLVEEVVAMTPDGLPLELRDADGFSHHFEYDAFGRMTCSREPEGVATRWRYDIQGRLIEKRELVGVDAANPDVEAVSGCAELEVAGNSWRSTTLAYDALGRVSSVTTPGGRTRSVEYDEQGQVLARSNAAGERVEYRYDDRGLLVSRTGPGVADRYAYDARGRLVLAANAAASRAIGYDALDRVTSVRDPFFGQAQLVYDADGRVSQAVYPDGGPEGASVGGGFPSGRVVTYHYDGRGQVSAIADSEPGLGVWQLSYDALGRPLEQRDPFGAVRRVSYDARGFVEGVVMQGSGYAHAYTYSDYDERGLPGQITLDTGGAPETTTIGYDGLGRIESIAYPGSASAEVYGYDRVRNRSSHERAGQVDTYEYSASNGFDQLLRITRVALGSPTWPRPPRHPGHAQGHPSSSRPPSPVPRFSS